MVTMGACRVMTFRELEPRNALSAPPTGRKRARACDLGIKFNCSFGNFVEFDNPMTQESGKKLHLRLKVGALLPTCCPHRISSVDHV